MFRPCDKRFKLVLIKRVTEAEMEASADRQDEGSIYSGMQRRLRAAEGVWLLAAALGRSVGAGSFF